MNMDQYISMLAENAASIEDTLVDPQQWGGCWHVATQLDVASSESDDDEVEAPLEITAWVDESFRSPLIADFIASALQFGQLMLAWDADWEEAGPHNDAVIGLFGGRHE